MNEFKIYCKNCGENVKLNENYNIWIDSIEIDFNSDTKKIEIKCSCCENKIEI